MAHMLFHTGEIPLEVIVPTTGHHQVYYTHAGNAHAGHSNAGHAQTGHAQTGHDQAGHAQAGHAQAMRRPWRRRQAANEVEVEILKSYSCSLCDEVMASKAAITFHKEMAHRFSDRTSGNRKLYRNL